MPAPPRPRPARPPEVAPDVEVQTSGYEGRSNTRRFGSNAASEMDPKPANEAKPGTTPYLPGDVIQGKYKLTRIIGRGGMGAVWLAHNVPLDIDVAIKLIRRDRTAAGAAERLLTEARAAARLMHPAIVRVFDFGETEQHDPFIVMELLRGESLNAILRRKKRLTPAVAVQMMLPVAAALTSAHSKGIVHRDLKPDNIIVITDETGVLVPKIVDFGIAKLLTPSIDHQVTMAGEVLGSPDYMSPEQARGASNVGEPSDIWTFTVVLYELITGKRPFDGPNYNALIASIITSDAPPITAYGVGDAALSGIIEHGLAKDVAGRWPTMRELAAALATWAVANGIQEDVMGNGIAKQWLSSTSRRLLTVMPETGEAPQRSGPITPGSAQIGAVAVAVPRTMVEYTGSETRLVSSLAGRRTSARNALALAAGIVLVGLIGVIVFLLRDQRATTVADRPSDAPTVSSVPPALPAPSSSAVAPTPSAAASASAPDTSAVPDGTSAPAASASARPGLGRWPRKNKAPAAPKNIKF